jgi:hypothetical protein
VTVTMTAPLQVVLILCVFSHNVDQPLAPHPLGMCVPLIGLRCPSGVKPQDPQVRSPTYHTSELQRTCWKCGLAAQQK